jgi:hypothetical protein
MRKIAPIPREAAALSNSVSERRLDDMMRIGRLLVGVSTERKTSRTVMESLRKIHPHKKSSNDGLSASGTETARRVVLRGILFFTTFASRARSIT